MGDADSFHDPLPFIRDDEVSNEEMELAHFMKGTSTLRSPDPDNDLFIYSKELPEGTVLAHYKILKVLGSGGFGITYLAKDMMLMRKVVLKENFPAAYAYRDPFTGRITPNNEHDLNSYKWALSSFLKEARMLAELNHPGIVRVLSIFESNGTAYFSMDYVAGLPLDYLEEQQRLSGNAYSEVELKGLLVRLLKILDYLHEKGICHRDIKPGNILLTQDGSPVLIDFGSSRRTMAEKTITVLTTHGYSSPEQALGQKNTGPWSDLYSLGATFYALLKGEPPPRAEGRLVKESMAALASSPQLNKIYSKGFLETIDAALSPSVEDRYHSGQAWLKDLMSKTDGSLEGTIEFSQDEFKSARKRFFNLFTSTSSHLTNTEKEGKWLAAGRHKWLFFLGGLLVYFLVDYSVADYGFIRRSPGAESVEERLVLPLSAPLKDLSSIPVPQLSLEPKGESSTNRMESFDIRFDDDSLIRSSLPSPLPPRLAISCVQLRVFQENMGAEPLYLTVRDESGRLVATSLNAVLPSVVSGLALTGFRFVGLPSLRTDVPYRFSFETADHVPGPLAVNSFHLTSMEGDSLVPRVKFICAEVEDSVRALLDDPQNHHVRDMMLSSENRSRSRIDSFSLSEQEVEVVERLAAQGYAAAQYKISRLLLQKDGLPGPDAVGWLYKSAMGGYAIAQRDMAFMLMGGREFFPDLPQCPESVSRNYPIAFRFLLMSLSSADPSVLYMLGLVYSQGWGVDRSVGKAEEIASLLKDSGYDLSRLNLKSPILAHWELMEQQGGDLVRMRCSIRSRWIPRFAGLRLVQTSKTGVLSIDKVTLLQHGREVVSRTVQDTLNPDAPVLELPLTMENFIKGNDISDWTVEVTMAPGNTSGVMEMMEKAPSSSAPPER